MGLITAKTCEVCQRHNKKLKPSSGCLHPIPVKSHFWSQIGMDIIGPLPITTQGNKYIITLTDYFSKWAEASPLSDKTAASVSNFLFKVCLYSHNSF